MKNRNTLEMVIFLTLFSMLIAGCKVAEKPVTGTEEGAADTGALAIESSPGLAAVYIGEEYRGDTPVNLYNIPIGQYEVTIKKEGYADFKKAVNIKVGRTEEIDAALKPVIVEEKEPEKLEDEAPKDISMPKLNKINLSSFAMYYDFDSMQFTEIRTSESDLFSRRYDTYVHFTTLTPTKINVINKPVNEVQKEDCIFADIEVTPVFSGQTLCVRTGTGSVVAIGGVWQAAPTGLEWVLFG